MRRYLALACWCYLVWTLLTWTLTAEQIAFGIGFSVVVAVILAPLGEVTPPWRLLDPRVMFRCIRLVVVMLTEIVRANVLLAWLVCHRRPPIRSGMIIVPTKLRTDGGLAATGLLTSLVVDNQIVDVDRNRHELLYHAVLVPDPSRSAYEQVNGPIERQLQPLEGK